MKTKIIGILICLLLIATAVTTAGTVNVLKRASPTQLTDVEKVSQLNNFAIGDDLDTFIIDTMDEYHIPGLSASIVRNGSFLWTESYGYANISQSVYVQDTTLFILASIAKTIVATAIMQLYEQGFFDLDDPVNDYLPFQVQHPDYPSVDITFHMLVTHSSGIKDNWDVMPFYTGDPPNPLGAWLEDYLTPGGQYYDPDKNFQIWEPGTSWDYCNVGAALVGYLVEVLSGISFDEYCEINIFEPLDMDETAWFLADLDINHIAVPYSWNGYEYVPYSHWGVDFYPSGQLRTSVTQLRNFLLMYMNYGEYNSTIILDSDTVELILSPQLPPPYEDMGILWYKDYISGRELWGHGGAALGCRTFMLFELETNIGVIVLTNGEPDYDGLAAIIDALFDFAETPLFDIEITGGLGVTAEITNIGLDNAIDVPYEITVTGGLLGLINKTINGTIDIEVGSTESISSGLLLGLGGIEISVKVGVKEQNAEGIQLFIFTIVQ